MCCLWQRALLQAIFVSTHEIRSFHGEISAEVSPLWQRAHVQEVTRLPHKQHAREQPPLSMRGQI